MSGSAKEANSVHSRAYHRYFEGYAEKMRYKADGTPYITRVYVGNYYEKNMTSGLRALMKCAYAALYLAALTMLVVGGIQFQPVNLWLPVRVLSACTLIAYLMLSLPVFFNVTAPKKMVIRNFRHSSERLIGVSKAALVCAAALSAASVACMAIRGTDLSLEELLVPALYAVSTLCIWLLFWSEKHAKYTELAPENQRDPESSVVKYYTEE